MTGHRVIGPRLLQVTYVSTANLPLGEEDFAALIARARARNAAQGLTGFLFHQPPRFFGLLEGAERKVLARMEEIIADSRHRELTVLREERIREPRYRNWAFGLLPAAQPGSDGAAAVDFVRSLAGLRHSGKRPRYNR